MKGLDIKGLVRYTMRRLALLVVGESELEEMGLAP